VAMTPTHLRPIEQFSGKAEKREMGRRRTKAVHVAGGHSLKSAVNFNCLSDRRQGLLIGLWLA